MVALNKQIKKPTSLLLVFREKLETDQLQLHTNDANQTEYFLIPQSNFLMSI